MVTILATYVKTSSDPWITEGINVELTAHSRGKTTSGMLTGYSTREHDIGKVKRDYFPEEFGSHTGHYAKG